MQFAARRLAIPDVIVIVPKRFEDARGYFAETYRAVAFGELGMPEFVQDNQALSLRKGTIRALHFQKPPHAQAKLIRVLKGAIFDVAVDMRVGSRTFGQWVGATLTADGLEQIFVPRGFAHGYCTIEDGTEVLYKCDAYYAPEAEAGIVFSDPAVGVIWPVAADAAIVSERDRALPLLQDTVTPFAIEARR